MLRFRSSCRAQKAICGAMAWGSGWMAKCVLAPHMMVVSGTVKKINSRLVTFHRRPSFAPPTMPHSLVRALLGVNYSRRGAATSLVASRSLSSRRSGDPVWLTAAVRRSSQPSGHTPNLPLSLLSAKFPTSVLRSAGAEGGFKVARGVVAHGSFLFNVTRNINTSNGEHSPQAAPCLGRGAGTGTTTSTPSLDPSPGEERRQSSQLNPSAPNRGDSPSSSAPPAANNGDGVPDAKTTTTESSSSSSPAASVKGVLKGAWNSSIVALLCGFLGGWLIAGWVTDEHVFQLGTSLIEQQAYVEACLVAWTARRSFNGNSDAARVYLRDRVVVGMLPSIFHSWLMLGNERLERRRAEMEERKQQQAADRATMGDLLNSCSFDEQVEWLTEHSIEDIPYIYVADLFRAWHRNQSPRLLGPLPSGDARVTTSTGLESNASSRLSKEKAPTTSKSPPKLLSEIDVDVVPRDRAALRSVLWSFGLWRLAKERRLEPADALHSLALVTLDPVNAMAVLAATNAHSFYQATPSLEENQINDIELRHLRTAAGTEGGPKGVERNAWRTAFGRMVFGMNAPPTVDPTAPDAPVPRLTIFSDLFDLRVTEALRQRALRRLFASPHSPLFTAPPFPRASGATTAAATMCGADAAAAAIATTLEALIGMEALTTGEAISGDGWDDKPRTATRLPPSHDPLLRTVLNIEAVVAASLQDWYRSTAEFHWSSPSTYLNPIVSLLSSRQRAAERRFEALPKLMSLPFPCTSGSRGDSLLLQNAATTAEPSRDVAASSPGGVLLLPQACKILRQWNPIAADEFEARLDASVAEGCDVVGTSRTIVGDGIPSDWRGEEAKALNARAAACLRHMRLLPTVTAVNAPAVMSNAT